MDSNKNEIRNKLNNISGSLNISKDSPKLSTKENSVNDIIKSFRYNKSDTNDIS